MSSKHVLACLSVCSCSHSMALLRLLARSESTMLADMLCAACPCLKALPSAWLVVLCSAPCACNVPQASRRVVLCFGKLAQAYVSAFVQFVRAYQAFLLSLLCAAVRASMPCQAWHLLTALTTQYTCTAASFWTCQIDDVPIHILTLSSTSDGPGLALHLGLAFANCRL